MKIEISNIKQDNGQLNLKYAELMGGDEILLTGQNRLVPFREDGSNDKFYSFFFFSFKF